MIVSVTAKVNGCWLGEKKQRNKKITNRKAVEKCAFVAHCGQKVGFRFFEKGKK